MLNYLQLHEFCMVYSSRLYVHSRMTVTPSPTARVLTTDSVVPWRRCRDGRWNIGQAIEIVTSVGLKSAFLQC